MRELSTPIERQLVGIDVLRSSTSVDGKLWSLFVGQCRQMRLKRYGTHAQRRMMTLGVVGGDGSLDSSMKLGFGADIVTPMGKVLVFDSPVYPLGMSVLQDFIAHTTANAVVFQRVGVVIGNVLCASVGMMNQAVAVVRLAPQRQSHLQGGKRVFCSQGIRDIVANNPPRVRIHQERQVVKPPQDMEIRDVAHPYLVDVGEEPSFKQIPIPMAFDAEGRSGLVFGCFKYPPIPTTEGDKRITSNAFGLILFVDCPKTHAGVHFSHFGNTAQIYPFFACPFRLMFDGLPMPLFADACGQIQRIHAVAMLVGVLLKPCERGGACFFFTS